MIILTRGMNFPRNGLAMGPLRPALLSARYFLFQNMSSCPEAAGNRSLSPIERRQNGPFLPVNREKQGEQGEAPSAGREHRCANPEG
jgi:hypothetical protein